MAHVALCSDCWPYTGGRPELDVPAASLRELVTALEARYPGLGAFIDKRIDFAIDGEIHRDALYVALAPESEVYLIPRIAGG